MPKYTVTIQRVEHRSHEFMVEAKNICSAKDEAREEASGYDWANSPVGSADEEITSVDYAKEEPCSAILSLSN